MANVCCEVVGKCGDKPRLVVTIDVAVEHTVLNGTHGFIGIDVHGRSLNVSYVLDGQRLFVPTMRFMEPGSAEACGIVAQALAVGLRAVLVEGAKP